MYRHLTLIMVFALTPFIPSQASDFVSGDKLATLIIGKTIHGTHLKKGFEFSVYFDKDGKTALRKKQNGDIVKTTYRFDGNTHCIFWKGKDRCAKVMDNGDGTYTRISSSGLKIVKWTKLDTGNKL